MLLPALLLAAALPASLAAADPQPGEDLFPLAVGNTWTYKVYPFPNQLQEDRFVVRVVKTEVIGDQTCFLLEGRLRDRVVASEFVAFTEDGLTRFRVDRTDVTPPVTILKFPVEPKKSWEVSYHLGDRKGAAKFTPDSDGIRYQGRRVRATKVEGDMTGGENGTRVKSTAWYAPGVGMVRQQIEEGKRTTVLDLEKFVKAE